LQKNPSDDSVQDLLLMDEVRRKADSSAQTPGARLWSRYMLGQSLALQHKDDEAINELTALINSPMPPDQLEAARAQQYGRRALTTLADIYLRRNDMEKAGNYRHQAALIPDQPQLIEGL
jgi:hypothetical protein